MKKVTRRRFVGGLLESALLAAVAPAFIPSRILAADTAPSKRIQLGHIGTGGQGTNDLRNFLTVDGGVSIAICDPYRQRRENAATFVKAGQNITPTLYEDFRELLANPSIDAVVIATPDHWHVPIGLAAVKAGKDVYIEKPLSHCLNHNMLMKNAIKSSGRIFQYGTQQRSEEIVMRCVELVLNGYIGDLQHIDVWAPPGQGGGSLVEVPVPEGLNYDLYIGPAPMKPCTSDRLTSNGSWYCSDYALGFIAGWGAHPLDVAIWGMNSDTKGPFKVTGKGTFLTPSALFNTCTSWDVNIEFADKVTMHFMSSDLAKPFVAAYLPNSENGTTFIGTKGWVSVGRYDHAASQPDWLKIRDFPGKQVLYKNRYYNAFVESVRDRSTSIAPVDDAVRSDSISHLSLLAIKNGGTVIWDPQAYKIISPDELNSEMDIPVRGSWLNT